jgi:hypothetical protein
MPTQPHTPTPPGRGPAERRWTAAYNQARRTVIVAHWPKPGSGQLMRCWHCLTCKETIYDEGETTIIGG